MTMSVLEGALAFGFVVQFGDPQTKDPAKKAMWGSGGSGKAP